MFTYIRFIPLSLFPNQTNIVFNIQFKVIAADNSTSPRKSEVTVYVNVLRNLNPPVFVQKVYNATISEYAAIQTSVIQVRATDQDAIRNPLVSILMSKLFFLTF